MEPSPADPARPARLHLVDGTYELFRAHFSKRPAHEAPGGFQAKAVVGIASAILALLHDGAEAVTHMAVAFDNPIRSFRNDLYEGYKSDEGVEPELRAQFDAAEEAVRALGVAVWSMREHEADDALATGAARFGDAVEQVRILSPDKDMGQCLRGRRVVQVVRQAPPKPAAGGAPAPAPKGDADAAAGPVPRGTLSDAGAAPIPVPRGTLSDGGGSEGTDAAATVAAARAYVKRELVEVDEDAFRARRGVAPASLADLLALTGDDADGYPGLPGFGEKTAAALLARFGRIEAIPDDPAAWPAGLRGAPKLAATLRERRPEALLYRRLATLVLDAPLPGTSSLEDLRFRGVPREPFLGWCERLDVSDLRARPRRWSA